jgi:hypothetical protein
MAPNKDHTKVSSLLHVGPPSRINYGILTIILLLIAIASTTAMPTSNDLSFLNELRSKYNHQPTFLQAVEEMAVSLMPVFDDPIHGDFYRRAFVAMTEPERAISFRVPWMDDTGKLQFNRGFRVEFNRYGCALVVAVRLQVAASARRERQLQNQTS